MKSFIRIIPFFLVLLLSSVYFLAYADEKIVVVVNPQSGIDSLTKDEVVNIFMGRYRKLSSGAMAQPIDQMNSTEKAEFYKKLVGKNLAEINSYWARLVFSGKTTPPRMAKNTEELLDLMVTLPGAVAYMDIDQIDVRAKVVLKLY